MADISDKGTRRLPYPLLNPLSTNQDTPDETIDFNVVNVFPIDPDEKIDIKINLSLNEYVAIASAVDVGRDIAFSEDTTLIWWLWNRIFKGLAGSSMSCEDIADCIETSTEVQDAITTNQNIIISNLMETANSGIDNPKVEADTDTILTLQTQGAIGTDKIDEIKELANCNLDALWAGIRDGIVQRLDDNARSVLEYLVSKADLGQRATALIGAIPIFGSMAKSVLDQMVELAPDMLNLFESYSSIGNMDEIACEIFGLVCSECRYPTYDEVFQYYASAGVTGFTDIDDLVIAAATDLLFGSTELAALAFYHTMIAYELLILYMGSKFYGFSGSAAIITMASLGEDFANDNWELLCSSCNDPYRVKVWDFTQSPSPANPTTGHGLGAQGTYIAGKGWGMNAYEADPSIGVFRMGLNLDPTWKIRAIGLKFSNQAAGDGSMTNSSFRPVRGTEAGASPFGFSWGTTGWTYYINGFLSITGFEEFAFAYAAAMSSNRYWTHVAIIFDADFAPEDAIPTNDPTLSGTVFP